MKISWKSHSLIGCWQEVVDPCLHFNWYFLGGSGEPEDASEICGWKAQKEQKDVVVFLKFSVSGSYDLLRRKAGLRRWAAPGEGASVGPAPPQTRQEWEKVTGICVLQWS